MAFPVACYPRGSGQSANSFVGPLDAYTADLQMALLPFRGFSSYTGALWRVRDDGAGDAEQDLVCDAEGEPVFPPLAGNGGLVRWYNQPVNVHDLEQSTAASQAYLINNVLNGYPVARFDGVDDEMIGYAAGDDRTVYMVCRMNSPALNARAWKDCTASLNADVYANGDGNYWYYDANPGVVSLVGGPYSAFGVVTMKYSFGTTVSPYFDNVPAAAFGNTGYATNPAFILGSSGGGNFGAVDVAARLVYSAAHGDSTRQAIQSILATKFGITLAP